MINKKTLLKSLGIVLLLAGVLLNPGGIRADLAGNTTKATLSLSPVSGSYKVGDSFDVNIIVNTAGENVNVVSAYINYDKSRFLANSISSTGSVFTSGAEESIDSSSGQIKITRGIPAPGISTASGKVASVNFKAISATSPAADNITFVFTAGSENESNVVKNSDNTDILTGVYNAKITVTGTSDQDLVPPTISAVVASSITKTSAVINWTTNEVADSQVEYGSSVTYGSQSTLASSAVTSHSVTLSGLTANTSYHYRVKSKDAAGNLATSGDYTFKTTADGQVNPVCGDNACNGSETCSSCSADCGVCQVGPVCGNGSCEVGETCSACSQDCGSCTVVTITEGNLIRVVNDPKVYLIQNNQKRWVATASAFDGLGYKWTDVKVLSESQVSDYTTGSPIASPADLTPITDPSSLKEGDLIRGPDGIKVYIINAFGYKRHIYNPVIFNMYGHLKWENIKAVDQSVLDHYETSFLFMVDGASELYFLNEMSFGAMKRLLINYNVFNVYNNKVEAIFVVMQEELNLFEDVTLVKPKLGYKIYLIEGTTKKWIETGEAFDSKGYDWQKVVTVWPAELAEFTEGESIK